MHNRVKIYPEVHDTLERLVQEGYHIGLWSDTPWQCPGSVIEQYMLKYKIRRFFDVALFSGDKDNKKPNPEVFQMVLNVAEQPKDQMVYIGNSEKDILTSHRFGVPVVWVNRPDNEIELTKDSPEPDYEIESLDQIFEILPIS